MIFDEGENDKVPDSRTPNARILHGATTRGENTNMDKMDLETVMPDFQIVDNPWEDTQTIEIDLHWDYDEEDNRPMGFSIDDCSYMH